MDGDESDNRRRSADRREHPGDEGRRGAARSTSALQYVLRAIGAVVVLVLVIVYAVSNTRPVFATRGSLGEELRRHAPEVAKAIGVVDTTNVEQIMATPKFRAEKRNFYEDVMRLKQVDSARADSIAQFAVREAYLRGISPAIIFGVMLTENARFVSKATSNVGAVGLMQVYPKVWATKEMTAKLGKDIATDSTNVKYGVFILSHYFHPRTAAGSVQETDWATALLHYNGCVKGTNTPRCHTYPNKVQQFIEGSAKSICDGRSFYDCIAKPIVGGLFAVSKSGTDTSAGATQAGALVSEPQPDAGSPRPTAPPILMPPALVLASAAVSVPPPDPPIPAAEPSRSASASKRKRSGSPSPAHKKPTRTPASRSPQKKKAPAKRTSTKHTAALKPPKRIEIRIP